MDLQYISRTDRDEEGKYYEIYFLCDMHSGRSFGYVEEPSVGSDQFMFVSTPFDGQCRRYLSLDKAKEYLERVAVKEDARTRKSCQKANPWKRIRLK